MYEEKFLSNYALNKCSSRNLARRNLREMLAYYLLEFFK